MHIALADTLSPSWDLVADIQILLHYPFMQNAYLGGTLVALTAGIMGYFMVLRSQSFAGHSLANVGFAGATGADLFGIPPVVGLFLAGLLAAAGIQTLNLAARERRQSDIAVGAVFTASLDPDVAAASGVPVRLLAFGYLVLLALTVAVAVQVVGVLLIFALLVTPAAIAQEVTTRPAVAAAVAVALALIFTWVGLAVGYFTPYPVGFFITTFAFGTYALVRGGRFVLDRMRRRHLASPPGSRVGGEA